MITLLIIADDFTGALDTGVQFSACGIRTRVCVEQHFALRPEDDAQVLVIDAETRHLPAEKAYETVYQLAAAASEAGVPYIYKKTDSALRGNIGSELAAVLDASGATAMPFIPAFPKMNRYTRGGIHYIDGVPVSQSVFGQDPFEPVSEDRVRDIIRSQRDVAVAEISGQDRSAWQPQSGILVFDAETDTQLQETAGLLKEQGLCRVMAGCAGFASVLPELLGLEGTERDREPLPSRLFFLCGSVNPITRKQVAYGVKCGYQKISLRPEQKLETGWWDGDEGARAVNEMIRAMEMTDCCIVDSNDEDDSGITMEYGLSREMTLEEIRVRISEQLGVIAGKVLEQGLQAAYLITGGDTLLGVMKQIGCSELIPIRELAPGVVLGSLYFKEKKYYIITKSGGFGAEELLPQLVAQLG